MFDLVASTSLTFFPLSIDWFFLSIDTLGGLFSLFALGMAFRYLGMAQADKLLAAQGSFDILGGIMYIFVSVDYNCPLCLQ